MRTNELMMRRRSVGAVAASSRELARQGTGMPRAKRTPRADRTVSGVVLAGSCAWNRSPLDRAIARPLLPIANRPLVTYALSWLTGGPVRNMSVCGNSHTRELQSGIATYGFLDEALTYHADFMPRGPAGCVRDAVAAFGTDYVVVVDGTVIPQVDIDELIAVHQEHRSAVTVVTSEYRNIPNRLPLTIPIGIYVISAEAIEMIAATGYQDIKEELIPALHEKGMRVEGFNVQLPSPRVTGVATYFAVNDWMIEQAGQAKDMLDDNEADDPSHGTTSSQIDPSAKFVGPVMVGPGTVVGPDVIVIGPTSIGANCRIGAGTVISRSSIWEGSLIGDSCVIDRSVVAAGAQVVSGGRLQNEIRIAE